MKTDHNSLKGDKIWILCQTDWISSIFRVGAMGSNPGRADNLYYLSEA